MKKIITIVLVIGVLCAGVPAYAGENALSKLGRGLCNLVTFPMEIIEQSKKVKEKEGSIAGMTYGLGKGITMSVVRAVVGVYEVGTFPIPYPNGYGPILTDPVSYFPEPKKEAAPQ